MSESILFVLRILMAITLYAFLGWALLTLWRELRSSALADKFNQIPTISITPLFGNGTPQLYHIPEIIIGRDAGCDFPIPEDSVSKHHSRLSYHNNQWWVEDLNSTNGTFINNVPVKTPFVIISGDEIRCGSANLQITILSMEEQR
jgi:hypothetical protein